MSLTIYQATLGLVQTNTYLLGDSDTGTAILIDPVDDAPLLMKMAAEHGLTIKYILATHAHFDHILASAALKELTNAPFYIHQDCEPWLEHLPQQGRMFGLPSFPEAAVPDHLLTNEDEWLEAGPFHLQLLHTPGHAPGHISFFLPEERIVFSGDCLFAGSIGRTDLPGADYHQLMQSIFDKLVPLGDDVRVLPGHMRATTIGRERQTNPFLLDYEPEA